MELGKTVIVAGIGSRKGVGVDEVVAAVDAALEEYGVARSALGRLATMEIKRGERGIFEAGVVLGVEVVIFPSETSARADGPPPLVPPRKGEGDSVGVSIASSEMEAREAPEFPSPFRGGVRGGGGSEGGAYLEKASSPSSPAGEALALPLTCLPASSPRERGEEKTASALSFKLAGVSSVSEAAALAAAGPGARLAGPRIAVGRVTCAIAFGDDT